MFTNMQPPTDLLKQQFPQIVDLEPYKIGGFKAVYRANIQGRQEAFKLIQLPPFDQDEIGDSFRKEAFGRIKREVEALRICNIPELIQTH